MLNLNNRLSVEEGLSVEAHKDYEFENLSHLIIPISTQDDINKCNHIMDGYTFAMIILGWTPNEMKENFERVSQIIYDGLCDIYKEYEGISMHATHAYASEQYKLFMAPFNK